MAKSETLRDVNMLDGLLLRSCAKYKDVEVME